MWNGTEVTTRSSCHGKMIACCLPTVIIYVSHNYDPYNTSSAKNCRYFPNSITSHKTKWKLGLSKRYHPKISRTRNQWHKVIISLMLQLWGKTAKRPSTRNHWMIVYKQATHFQHVSELPKKYCWSYSWHREGFPHGRNSRWWSRLSTVLAAWQAKIRQPKDCSLQVHKTCVWVMPLACYFRSDNFASSLIAQRKRPWNCRTSGKIVLRWWPVNGGVRWREGPGHFPESKEDNVQRQFQS